MRYFFLFFTLLFFHSCVENIDESQTSLTDDSLLVERALLNVEKENLEEAKKDLETAHLIDTTNGNTHYLLGDILLELAKQGKGSEESVKLSSFHFKSAIKYKSDSALAYQKDGEISMYLGEHIQAIELLSKSRSVDETDTQTLILLGYCYRELDQVKNAIYCFEKTISLNENSDEAYVQLGQIFWEKQDSTAIKYYKSAISINPNNRDAYYNLGLVYHSLNEFSKSQDAYHKIIELGIKDRYFIEANYNLALMFMDDLKDYKNALNNYLIEVVRANPNHYLGYFRMAICYQTLGDVRNAEQYYRKVLEINPEFKEAADNLNKLLSDNEKYK